jgi:hypothetical protein
MAGGGEVSASHVGVHRRTDHRFRHAHREYFTNSIREDGLLAIARSGVVCAPGGAGTEQEVFTDSAQNSLTLYGVRSPIVFFGRDFFEAEHPELLAAVRRQAAVRLVSPRGRATHPTARVHRPARPDASGRAASNGGASIRESDDAGTRRPRPPRSRRFRKRSRNPGRVRRAGRFPPEVDAEAAAVATRSAPTRRTGGDRLDARDIPWSPSTRLARDLDQAYHAETRPTGFRVHYDRRCRRVRRARRRARPGIVRRGVTLYLPDGRAPMLPNIVGQGAASLLADQDRPALLWTIELDSTGATTSARLERATVHSRAALDYPGVQATLDRGAGDASLALLREIGSLRRDLEAARGISLDLPSQEVVADDRGGFRLEYGAPLPVEGWSAQISLLAGIEAARS